MGDVLVLTTREESFFDTTTTVDLWKEIISDVFISVYWLWVVIDNFII